MRRIEANSSPVIGLQLLASRSIGLVLRSWRERTRKRPKLPKIRLYGEIKRRKTRERERESEERKDEMRMRKSLAYQIRAA